MSATDSVTVFAEGTFEEQIQELVNYIVRNRSEDERASFIRPFQEAFKTADGDKSVEEDEERRKAVFSMVLTEVGGLGDGSEKEIEGFFNLLYAHLFALYPADAPETRQRLQTLLQVVAASPSENVAIKYRILSNLFNAIPRKCPLRVLVFKTLLQLARTNDQLDLLQVPGPDVGKWIAEWDIPAEEKWALYRSVVGAYAEAGMSDTSYKYALSYARSLPKSSPSARAAAIDVIAATLRLPSAFDFDSLLKLDALGTAEDHELYSLLRIFLDGGLIEFTSWAQTHAHSLEEYKLDRTQLNRKIRLLTLASLAYKHVGQDLPYAKIATALQVDVSEVEGWVIDIVRTGLLSGKLSQTNQTLHVTRCVARTFEREQWEALEKRLEAWKSGLAGVLEVVSAARKKNVAPTDLPTQAPAQTALA